MFRIIIYKDKEVIFSKVYKIPNRTIAEGYAEQLRKEHGGDSWKVI